MNPDNRPGYFPELINLARISSAFVRVPEIGAIVASATLAAQEPSLHHYAALAISSLATLLHSLANKRILANLDKKISEPEANKRSYGPRITTLPEQRQLTNSAFNDAKQILNDIDIFGGDIDRSCAYSALAFTHGHMPAFTAALKKKFHPGTPQDLLNQIGKSDPDVTISLSWEPGQRQFFSRMEKYEATKGWVLIENHMYGFRQVGPNHWAVLDIRDIEDVKAIFSGQDLRILNNRQLWDKINSHSTNPEDNFIGALIYGFSE